MRLVQAVAAFAQKQNSVLKLSALLTCVIEVDADPKLQKISNKP